MATTTHAAPRKKKRIGRIIGLILTLLILPIVIGYFVLTSSTFFKRVILPKVGASLNASITVSDASIKPFSQVVLRQLTVTPIGKEPLLKVDEVRARYSLMDIIKGNINVSEATVISPVITIVEAADGSSNLDPLNEKKAGEKKEEKKTSQSEKALNLNIQNVSLKNARVERTKNLAGGGREVTEISNLTLSIDRLSNGQPGKLNLAADILMDRVPSTGTTNTPGSMRGKIAGAIDYKLTPQVTLESAKGNLRFDVSEAKGDMADLAQLGASLNCDVTPSSIGELSLQFSQANQPLGELRASGPFSFANMEGKLKVELASVDRRVLNLVGAASGIDFNSTVISSANDLVFTQKGNVISLSGQLNADKLSLTKKAEKKTTPVLELHAAYQLNVDQNAKSALIEKLEINGTQNEQKILGASLSKPMPISWGGASSAPENATLHLAITNLNLADWKAFAGDVAPSGKLNSTVDIISQQAGKQLSLNAISRIDAFSATFGSNRVSQADMTLTAQADIVEMQKVSIRNIELGLAQGDQPALQLKSSGTLDLKTSDADLKTTLDGTLAQLLKLVVMPDVSASSGTMKFEGRITQRKESKKVQGNFVIANFTGSYAGSPLDRFGAKFEADLEMNQEDLQIRKVAGELQQAGQAGGTLNVKGNYNSEKKTGNIEVKIADLNQNALRPFLAKSLGEKQLVTISVNGDTTAYLQEASSSFKGNIDVKNFVVRDPKKAQADSPLAAEMQMEGAMRKDVFDLKQFQITLSPTQRAKNQLNITGQLDTSKTNAIKGNLLVQSDAFDVTPFYDLYAGQPTATNAAGAPASGAPNTSTPSNQEPEAKNLPVDQIIANINIAQFYLREMEIKNWRGTAKIEGSRLLLNPFQMDLNGAPVRLEADINLGVKGYTYSIDGALDNVPLEPLANSFMPDKRGAYQGTIIGSAKIKGAGTTGTNLKKTLTGQADFVFTNANIQVVGKRLKPFLNTVAIVLQAPELTASPVKWTAAHLQFGDGKIHLKNFEMRSDAFTANTSGQIPIADVLTNSPLGKMPVNFGLSYSLAQKARLTSSTTPTNSPYVMLPGFLFAGGTIGEPKPVIDKAKLLGTALEKFGGKIPGVDDKTGNLIQGLGGILSGGTKTAPAVTNPVGTNVNSGATNNAVAPKTTNSNEQLINGVLDLFNKKKKK